MSTDVPDLILDTLLFTLEHALMAMEVYPKESFSKTVFYGIHVDHTRHEDVQLYLDGLRAELDKLIQRKRLARVFFDFDMDDSTIITIGISFSDFFLNDGRGIGWKVIGAPSKRDSWITVIAGLKTWFLQMRTMLDQVENKANEFNVRISSIPDDQLILDEHWGLDSSFDPSKIIQTGPKVISLNKIPNFDVDLGDDGKLKLHSYLVKRAN